MNDGGLSAFVGETRRLSGLIDQSVADLAEASKAVARAEHAYRKGKAAAWATVPTDRLAAWRAAEVDAITADLRLARDMADAARWSAAEALRSRRAQLDALRSVISASRSEMELAR